MNEKDSQLKIIVSIILYKLTVGMWILLKLGLTWIRIKQMVY